MATVQLRGVSKAYSSGSQTPALAVKQVDLNVRDGEFVVLVGPSGCGKTTTLRMIAGLEDVSEGEISIGERLVNQVPPKDRNIAMVFQNYALYPHMNVYRNMAFGLELRYCSDWWSRLWLAVTQPKRAVEMSEQRRGIPQRVQQTAEMLGIQHLLQRLPAELSGGEKQRVALGRAIVRQPAAFLFDEPLSNLDAQLRTDMRRELKRLHSELKATMIYVTHDQIEAMTLGDRVVVMNKGEVRQIGTPLEVYDKPADTFVAQFLGSPPMNLIEGQLAKFKGADHWTWWSMVQSETISGEFVERLKTAGELKSGPKMTWGVRPEDLKITLPLDEFDVGDWEGRVETIETLGDSTLLHIRVQAGQICKTDIDRVADAEWGLAEPKFDPEYMQILVAKIHGRTNAKVGSRVKLEYDTERRHWFDTNTGKRINV